MSVSLYFAHPISDYGTAFESKIVETLELQGLLIENPNQPHHQEGYARGGMDYFMDQVLPLCGGCVFLPFPGGLIGSGVAMEIEHFMDRRQQVIEVGRDPGLGTFLLSCFVLDEARILSRDETRGVTKVMRSLPNGGR
jgi:hypothetical protein